MSAPFEHPSEVAAAVADIASLGTFSNDWVLQFTGIVARIPPMAARNYLPKHVNTCPGCRHDIPTPTACMSCAAKRSSDVTAPAGQWAHEKSAQAVFRLKHEYLARVVALEAMIEQAQKHPAETTTSPYRAHQSSTPKQMTVIAQQPQHHVYLEIPEQPPSALPSLPKLTPATPIKSVIGEVITVIIITLLGRQMRCGRRSLRAPSPQL